MRIVYLSASAGLGGAERVLVDLLAELRVAEPAWELHLVCGADGPLRAAAEEAGATVHLLPLPRALERFGDAGVGTAAAWGGALPRLAAAVPGAVAWGARLRRLLGRLRPELVHSNGFKTHLLGAAVVPRGTPLVWHLHDYVSTRALMSLLMRRARRRCAAAVAVSHSVADDARAVCGRGFPVHAVHNAVDLDRFHPRGPVLPLNERAGMPLPAADAVVVGLVATMGLWKGHDVFLRALALLPPRLPLRAYVVGGRIYRTAGSEVDPEALRRQAAELGLADRVGFTGFVEDSAAAMRALDVVVHASTAPEPFGLVIAEAMACGRPVVVSAAGGAAEIAGAGAVSVPPGDAEALAAALLGLARDPEHRARLGRAGRIRAERDFDRARFAAEVARVYRGVAR
ncbi:MAG TPA: glycosyltransferase family 4 protein [Longimicrobium sp.]|nr:glycosyltransferase family 4 protein [Longimicrobium sp.]